MTTRTTNRGPYRTTVEHLAESPALKPLVERYQLRRSAEAKLVGRVIRAASVVGRSVNAGLDASVKEQEELLESSAALAAFHDEQKVTP